MRVFDLIALLGALVLALAGGAGVWWWDHHPPLHWRGPIPLVGPRLDLPDSLQSQRDQAAVLAANAVRERAQCDANASALLSAVRAQNVAVAALGQESRARVAQSQKAVQAARAVAQSYAVRAQAILDAKPQGDDLCAAADRLILQEAR